MIKDKIAEDSLALTFRETDAFLEDERAAHVPTQEALDLRDAGIICGADRT